MSTVKPSMDEDIIGERPGKIDEGVGRSPLDTRPVEERDFHKNKSWQAKHRRTRQKAYQPYYQLSESDRALRDKRELLRETKRRERMIASGRMSVEYNSNQFLLSDKQEAGVNPPKWRRSRDPSFSTESDEYFFSDPSDEEEFNCKEFQRDYQGEHENQLGMMTKKELLSELVLLERKNESLVERLKNEGKNKREEEGQCRRTDEQDMMIRQMSEFKEEVSRLTEDNSRLVTENKDMKKLLESQGFISG